MSPTPGRRASTRPTSRPARDARLRAAGETRARAQVEKSRAARDPITFQLHGTPEAGAAEEEPGAVPGARDGNDRAFPLPPRARKQILARLPKFLDE